MNQEQPHNNFGKTVSTGPQKNIDFAWREVRAITMNEVWKNLCLQFAHSFHGFEKVDEKCKEVLSDLVTLSKKLELDPQEDSFMELFAVHHEELTNAHPTELEAQRKDRDERKR